MATANLVPKPGHEGTFHVEMAWGDAITTPTSEDTGAVAEGYASISWLGRIEAVAPDHSAAESAEGALTEFFGD